MYKPKRPCGKVGCRNISIDRYCDEHAYIAEQQRRDRHKHYDKHQRDHQAAAFYNNKAWRLVRDQAMMRDKGLCQHCLKHKRIVTADMVHHQKPVKTHWKLRLQLDNLISLCQSCHNKIDHKTL